MSNLPCGVLLWSKSSPLRHWKEKMLKNWKWSSLLVQRQICAVVTHPCDHFLSWVFLLIIPRSMSYSSEILTSLAISSRKEGKFSIHAVRVAPWSPVDCLLNKLHPMQTRKFWSCKGVFILFIKCKFRSVRSDQVWMISKCTAYLH